MHSDQPNNGRRGIFDRLELNCDSNGSHSNGSSSSDSPVLIGFTSGTGTTATPATLSSTTASSASSSASSTSIFKRLGGKTTATTTSAATSSTSDTNHHHQHHPAITTTIRVQQQQQQPLVQRTFSNLAASATSASACISLVSTKPRGSGLVASGGGITKKLPQQKVILVKKQPAKATRPDLDYAGVLLTDSRDYSGTYSANDSGYKLNRSGSEKCVSFSEEDEVLEFATETPRQAAAATVSSSSSGLSKTKASISSVHAIVPVKHRLGFNATATADSAAVPSLHRTRKTVPLKVSPNTGRTNSTVLRRQYNNTTAATASVASKSSARVPIHSRLTLTSGSNAKSSGGSAAISISSSRTTKPAARSSVTSVFQRLGFTD